VFWSSAIQYEHLDLMELLLDDERCDLNTPFDVPSPLFTVIKTGDVELLRVFLCACPLVNVVQDHMQTFMIEGEPMDRQLSAVTYACYYEEMDMLKLLMSYYKQNNERSVSYFIFRF